MWTYIIVLVNGVLLLWGRDYEASMYKASLKPTDLFLMRTKNPTICVAGASALAYTHHVLE